MPSRTFSALSHFIHHHLLWFLISAYVVAAVFPAPGLWIRTLIFGELSVFFQAKLQVSVLLLLLATWTGHEQ